MVLPLMPTALDGDENLFQIPYETMQSLAIVVGAAIQMGMVDPSFIPICFAPLPCASFLQRFVIKFKFEQQQLC